MALLMRASRKTFPFLLAAACGLGICGVAGVARAQGILSEYDVKAAFLFNFTKFVEWPPPAFADERSPLKLCVLGENPFGKTLRALTGEEVGGRRLLLTRPENLNNLESCHVLYVSRSERERLSQILAGVRNAPVLTVGDTPGFIDQVRFDINQEAAERAGIKISSRLLALAKHVKGRP
jgi:hypothetical protein